jgi:hypothetical protein
MTRFLSFVAACSLSSAALAQPVSPAASALDGQWRGTSDGGSCNAPLDYVLTIEAGIVDGSAFDTTVKGPQPNLKKAPPPPPGPGLWQVYGVAKGNTFSLTALASVQGSARRSSKLAVVAQGNTLTVSESGGGCGRTARLRRG